MKKEEKKYKEDPKVTQEIYNAKSEDIKDISSLFSEIPELETLYQIRHTVIEAIEKEKPIPKFKNLYKLTTSINLMTISHKKISKNKRADTKGSDETNTVEKFSYKDIQKLSTTLINKTFKWKTIKQILIPQKNKKPRPIGIINYSEKIIQNNILMILEAIYEPIFEHLNVSFGFRPHKGCIDAIEEITHYKNQGLNLIIEGNIKGAFNNIHPPKLANILKNYIDDTEFIQLIYSACTNPITIKNKIIQSPKGTPQGSIISPILFNIYMHEFDLETLKLLEEKTNQFPAINPVKDPTTKEYAQTKWKLIKLKKIIEKHKKIKTNRELTQEEKNENTNIKKAINSITQNRNKKDRYDYTRLPLRFAYNRYVDDFIIMINKSYEICENIKTDLGKILKQKFYLELSIEKTKITKIKNQHAKYLGYTLFMTNRKATIRKNTDFKVRPGRQILCGPDLNKIYSKLIEQNFAYNKTLHPKSQSSWSTLTPQEIILLYNAKIIGIYNYYYPIITYKTELSRIYYILYYSCLKTLAQKYRSTTAKIYKKHGWQELNVDLKPTNRTRIVFYYYTINEERKKIDKYAILVNYRDIIDMSKNNLQSRITWNKLKQQKQIGRAHV